MNEISGPVRQIVVRKANRPVEVIEVHWPHDEEAGVRVPAGPKPRCDGGHAKPPLVKG